MKLVLAYIFKGELYNRFTGLQRKQTGRKNRIMYARSYMERLGFLPDSHDILYDILHLRPNKKSYQLLKKLYTLKDISALEKEFPL